MTISLFLSFVFATILGPLAPGPNTLTIFRVGIFEGKKRSLFSALGSSVGDSVSILLALLTVSFLGDFPDTVLPVIGVLGALYLGSNGYISLRSTKEKFEISLACDGKAPRKNVFIEALLIALLNPKTLLAIISIFSGFSLVNNTRKVLIALALVYIINVFLVYGGIALLSSSSKVQLFFKKYSTLLHRAFGIFYLLFAFVLLGFVAEKILGIL